MKKLSFWDKVEKCKHNNISGDYFVSIPCPTPYCYGHEVHCLDCGVYLTECKCGFLSGSSGWPYARWKKYF